MTAPARRLDGKALAQKLQAEFKARVAAGTPRAGRAPGLAVLVVGDNPASAAYVRNKERACTRVGIASFGKHYPTDTTQEELSRAIAALNDDSRVDGILLQLPLPEHLDATALLYQVRPDKDADGLHPLNLGQLVRGEPGPRSCTPAGVMRLLLEYEIPVAGRRAVVLGRSILVGKPIALMLLAADASVSILHSRTPHPEFVELLRGADIIVSAVGRPNLVTADTVKPGAIVIDVGIARVSDAAGNTRLTGDVDAAAVAAVAGALTPVPGGVGPMTVTMLLFNTIASWEQRHAISSAAL